MKYVIYIFAVLIAFGLEVGIFGQFPLARTLPDLVLIMVVFFAIKLDNQDAYIVALVGGLLMDFYSGTAIGTFTLAYLLVAVLAQGLYRSFIVHELSWKQAPAVLVAATVLLYAWIIFYGWLLVKTHWTADAVTFSDLRSRFLPQIIYSFLALYPMLAVSAWLEQTMVSLQRRRHIIK
jgi:rod shape-determining protein MreD